MVSPSFFAFSMSNSQAADCFVDSFELHNNLLVHNEGAFISSSTERCAQILLKCERAGSAIIESDEFRAKFADGSQRTAMQGFEDFRLAAGASREVFACFGSSQAPIVSIVFTG